MGQNSKAAQSSRAGTPTSGVAGGLVRPSPTKATAPVRLGPENPITPRAGGGEPRPLLQHTNRRARPLRRRGGRVHLAPGLAVGSGSAWPEKPDRAPRAKRIRAPLNFVSVRKKSVVCFVQITGILIEPLFRLEITRGVENPAAKEGKSRDRSHNAARPPSKKSFAPA